MSNSMYVHKSIPYRNCSKGTCLLHGREMTYRVLPLLPKCTLISTSHSMTFGLFTLGTHLSSPICDTVKSSPKSCSVRVLAQYRHSLNRCSFQFTEKFRRVMHVDTKLSLRIIGETPVVHTLPLQLSISENTRWIMRREGQKEGEVFKKLSASYQNY